MWGHALPEKISNLEAQKCHFLRFPQDIFIFFLDIRENLQVTLYNYALSAPETKISKSKLLAVFMLETLKLSETLKSS